MTSNLEQEFITRWIQLGGKIDQLTQEYKFLPDRKYRFDFVCLEKMVAIEIEGGTWTQGRHSRGPGYSADCEKYNLAQLAGWRVFRFTSDMLQNDPAKNLLPIIKLLTKEDFNNTCPFCQKDIPF